MRVCAFKYKYSFNQACILLLQLNPIFNSLYGVIIEAGDKISKNYQSIWYF